MPIDKQVQDLIDTAEKSIEDKNYFLAEYHLSIAREYLFGKLNKREVRAIERTISVLEKKIYCEQVNQQSKLCYKALREFDFTSAENHYTLLECYADKGNLPIPFGINKIKQDAYSRGMMKELFNAIKAFEGGNQEAVNQSLDLVVLYAKRADKPLPNEAVELMNKTKKPDK